MVRMLRYLLICLTSLTLTQSGTNPALYATLAADTAVFSRCVDIEQIRQLMQKNGERKIPSIEVEEFTFFIDVEDTIAHWEHRSAFDWDAYWKNPKIGSEQFKKIKGPMFKQIRVLMEEFGWTKEEVTQRLLRGYFEALANERIVYEPTEWSPDFDELVTTIRAKKYKFIIYSHAMITFAAYEARDFCKKLNAIIAKHNLNAQIEFICGSDLEFFQDIELEVVKRIQGLSDPKHNLKDYLNWYESEFKHVRFSCLTAERKDQPKSWDFLFKLLKVNLNTSGAVLFDNEEKNRAAFLAYLTENS